MSRKYTTSWETLFNGGYPKICNHFREWNRQFPTKAEATRLQADGVPVAEIFTRAYPRRIKTGEERTVINLYRLWCRQAAEKINKGDKVITNIVEANSQTARDGKGSSSGTNTHLGKAAYTGFLRGEYDNETICFADQFETPHGKGFGVRPLKNFRGTKSDFQLLIHSDFIPVDNLPKGVVYMEVSEFAPTPKPYEKPQIYGHKMQNLEHTKYVTLNSINKTIITKAPESDQTIAIREAIAAALGQWTDSGNLPADLAGAADGNPDEVEPVTPEMQTAAAAGTPTPPADLPATVTEQGAAAPPRAGIFAYQDASGRKMALDLQAENAFRRLFMAGNEIAAFAVLLIQAYLKNLAKAMSREYVPAEISRAQQKAMQLLSAFPQNELSETVDRLIFTIEHMGKWIHINPSKNFVLPPSRWFDIGEKANILGAERLFLRKWETQKQLFQDAALLKQKVKEATDQDDQRISAKSDLHGLALIMKRTFMKFHPNDYRLKISDLDKWAAIFRMMIAQDKTTEKEIESVARWMMFDTSKGAEFWRKTAGGRGIRSAAGFRKNFKTMRDQMQMAALTIPKSQSPTPKRKYY